MRESVIWIREAIFIIRSHLSESLLFSHSNKRKKRDETAGAWKKTLLPNQSCNKSCSMESWASFILRVQHPRNHFQRLPVWLVMHPTGTKKAQETNRAPVFGYDGWGSLEVVIRDLWITFDVKFYLRVHIFHAFYLMGFLMNSLLIICPYLPVMLCGLGV